MRIAQICETRNTAAIAAIRRFMVMVCRAGGVRDDALHLQLHATPLGLDHVLAAVDTNRLPRRRGCERPVYLRHIAGAEIRGYGRRCDALGSADWTTDSRRVK